tara:strand:- start:1237 stop:2304 length:1068 start_codon:yes stop_codon:yes gene_type:complete
MCVTTQAFSHFKLQKEPHRARLYRELPPIWWSDQAKRWFVTNPELVRQIQTDTAFKVPDYDASPITERLGIDLTFTNRLRQYLPLAWEGAEHKRLRRLFSSVIAANQNAAIESFGEDLRRRLSHALASDRFCMVADVLRPALRIANMRLAGFSTTDGEALPDIESIPGMFDDRLSPTGRKRIEQNIRDLYSRLPDARDEESKLVILAFTALSANTLLGSLAESLLASFAEAGTQNFSAIDYPAELPATGLPLIEKICITPCEIDGEKIAAGDRLRLFIEVEGLLASGKPEYSDLYFAAGPHRCPGQAYSRRIWKSLRDELATLDVFFEIGAIEHRKNDCVFNYIEKLELMVHDQE